MNIRRPESRRNPNDSGSFAHCIYVDTDKYNIMSGQDHFGYWKTDITQELNTQAGFILIITHW